MAQVVDNLLSNAIKFSPVGSTIFVALTRQDGMIRASVRDQGPGICREDRDRLFEEFQRLSAIPTAGEKSTGLGLSDSQRRLS
jgi:signal transduction histidine kinase